jgi:AcrR family transcriptional regulator
MSEPATARGRRTREQLLRAAEVVFGKRGFEGASISEITRRAGVAQGTFYIYFPDKKSVYVELVEELGRRLRSHLAEAVEGLDDRIEVERAGLEAFFRFTRRHRSLYRLVRQAEFVDDRAFRAYYRSMAAPYAAGLAEAMDAEQIRRMDPEALAYCLMGIADFLGMRWALWEADAESAGEEIIREAMGLIHAGLAPDESTGVHP